MLASPGFFFNTDEVTAEERLISLIMTYFYKIKIVPYLGNSMQLVLVVFKWQTPDG